MSVYPPLYVFPGLNSVSYSGIPGTAITLLQSVPGLSGSYFQAYKTCTCFMMTITFLASTGTNTTTFTPYGSLVGGLSGAIGTSLNGTTSSGPFVVITQSQNFTLQPGGYAGISMTGTGGGNIWVGGSLWFTQAGPY